jgi:WD40 repeat protein
LFVSSSTAGEVLRFDSFTAEYKGVFIKAHEGGLVRPGALGFGPDNYAYVADGGSNRILKYDRDGNFVEVFADGETSDLNGPAMIVFDKNTLIVSSARTNSILRYDMKTKEYMGALVPPGSGGLVTPVGLEFGPDGNLYTSSFGTNEVLRYDGRTGEFIDKVVPASSGLLDGPRAIRFGGPNSDLYVINFNTSVILKFDRLTGALIRVLATSEGNGMGMARGLTFTAEPIFSVRAEVEGRRVRREHEDEGEHEREHEREGAKFVAVDVDHSLRDFTDTSPKVELVSIVSSDPGVDIARAVKNARYGKEDYHFRLDVSNNTGVDQHYTITYRATNAKGRSTMATTVVDVPALQ